MLQLLDLFCLSLCLSLYLSLWPPLHSDLDLVLGDLASWTDELLQGPEPKGDDEEKDWDLFTWGFGDQQRQYTRGQWTVHRNTDKVLTWAVV